MPAVVVDRPPVQMLPEAERFVVEAPPFSEDRPVTVRVPVDASDTAERVLAVSVLETIRLEVEAVPVTARLVVVAFVPVAFANVKF